MASSILDQDAATATFTITLASLASSTAGVGRQSTEIDNTSTKATDLYISVKITTGTSPSNNAPVYIYLIGNDNAGTPLRDDTGGASDAAWTALNAPLIGVLTTKAAASTGDVLTGHFVVPWPYVPPKFSLGIVNATGVALNATGGNHTCNYVLRNLQSQ